MKPNRGIMRDVFDVLNESEKPLAYNGIHTRLRKRGQKASAKQVKKALDNLQSRSFIERSKSDHRKFMLHSLIVKEKLTGQRELQATTPIPNPSLAEKTPESDQITPTNGLIDDRTLGELKQSILVKAITLAGMLSVIAIVSSVTAVLTINFLGFA